MKGMTMSRQFVIPDIHGCSRTFQELLEQLRLDRGDTLYLLGDYIDRGPDSRGVIETIMTLRRDGYDVRAVLGNHEDMLLNALGSGSDEDLWLWLDNGGEATLTSYGVRSPRDIDPSHIEFMRGLPLFCQTDTHIFVHAGLNFCLKDPLSPSGRASMLWQRTVGVQPEKIGNRVVVSGHTILSIEEIGKTLDTAYIRLDNGCFTAGEYKGMGLLTALEVGTGVLGVQEYLG